MTKGFLKIAFAFAYLTVAALLSGLVLFPVDASAKTLSEYEKEGALKEVVLPPVDQFPGWLDGFRKEARTAGISDKVITEAFLATQPIEKVILLDRKQPEGSISFAQYLTNTVSVKRISKGSEHLLTHGKLLSQVEVRYGVPAKVIVALWGIETDYGRNMGSFRTVDALATLAWEGRRHDFFRKELMNALRILDGGHIHADEMLGSWAGAMGQSQFMPTSYLQFAVDYNRDGRADIWTTQEDVFASIANYLASHGWQKDMGWGVEVQLPERFDAAAPALAQPRTVKEWTAMGVRSLPSEMLPLPETLVSLVMPGEDDGRAFLVTANYDVFKKWNRSNYFATAVGMLSDRLSKDMQTARK